ncbi:MAG: hypothetical protein U1F35_20660 [Steroidobacteraceae bacterium]
MTPTASVGAALANAQRAGVAAWIHAEKLDVRAPHRAPGLAGLLVANPPLTSASRRASALPVLYEQLGVLTERSPTLAGAGSGADGQPAPGAASGAPRHPHAPVHERRHRMPAAALRTG